MREYLPYFKLSPEDFDGDYKVLVDPNKLVPFLERWIEWRGKKYRCTKVGNEEWEVRRIDDFPFYKLPKDFGVYNPKTED